MWDSVCNVCYEGLGCPGCRVGASEAKPVFQVPSSPANEVPGLVKGELSARFCAHTPLTFAF